ncbi:MAG: tetratricopeptide repeat protein [Polyangiaceae bacterium]|nr:tetratricopeptide repeat protein [Polyangiaceae bacterium]
MKTDWFTLRRFWIFPLVALATMASPAAAGGDKSSPPTAPTASASPSAAASTPAAPETADSLYNQGNEAYDKGDLQLAYELYTGAFKLRRSYDIARNLGLVELKLGRYKAASQHFEYSLSLYPSNRAETKKQVIDWLDQARKNLGMVKLVVDPFSAKCSIAGENVGDREREAGVYTDPGDVRVECGGVSGYRDVRRVVTVEKGATANVALTLPAQTPGGGTGPVDVTPGGSRMTLVWVGSAVAAVSIGVGAVTGILSIVKASESDSLLADLKAKSGRTYPCTPVAESGCETLLASRKEQDAFGNIAFWTLLAGGLTGAGTAAFWFVTRPGEASPPPKTAVIPAVSPTGAGIVIQGSF